LNDAFRDRLVAAMRSPGQGADIAATHVAGFARFEPLTERAGEWLRTATAGEATWDGDALMVEIRYMPLLAEAAIAEGLTFERDELLN